MGAGAGPPGGGAWANACCLLGTVAYWGRTGWKAEPSEVANREAECLRGGVGAAVGENERAPADGWDGVEGDAGVEEVLLCSAGPGLRRVLSNASCTDGPRRRTTTRDRREAAHGGRRDERTKGRERERDGRRVGGGEKREWSR